MFQWTNDGDKLSCLMDQSLFLDDVRVSATLHAQGRVELALQAIDAQEGEDRLGSFTRYTAVCANEEALARAELAFTCYDRFLLLNVRASIQNKNAFGPQAGFAPESAVCIHIGEISGLQAYMANYRHKPWWSRPAFGQELSGLPPLTQSLLWQGQASSFGHMLPVCDSVCRTDLSGDGSGMSVRISPFVGGLDRVGTLALAIGIGEEPFELMERQVRNALSAGEFRQVPRADKAYPELLDYLGWCTWDAFYHEVNEKDILEKAEQFKQLHVPIRWVMIDDGWSKVNDGKLASFDAVPEKFPNGIKGTTETLKSRYGVKWTGVWHTIAGYWGGIDPDSEIGRRHMDSLVRTANGKFVPATQGARGFGFWNAWHSYLRRQGIDFVKVDSQSAVNHFHALRESVGEAATGAHVGLEASVALHFDDVVINCMGMASENIWHRPKSSLSRNSDDFVPQEQGSFREHALQNAYNSFYHGAFYWGDWDMYWTINHDDRVNMALRAVSGGPVYISDPLGRTEPAHVLPLVYRDGRIIRCDRPGCPTPDGLFVDPSAQAVPLKVWNTSNGSGIVAAFHVHPEAVQVSGTVGPQDIPGLAGDSFLLYDVLNRKCVEIGARDRQPLQLESDQYALLQIVPRNEVVTVLGLLNKLVPIHAVERIEHEGRQLRVTIREGGEFAFVSRKEPKVTIDGTVQALRKDTSNENLYLVSCEDASGSVTIVIQDEANS